MIEANKRRWFARWFARHAHRRLRRTFGSVQAVGLEHIRRVAAEHPVIVVANHTAWWDAMMILVLSERVLGLDGYAMMDAANLRRYRFFALAGAFGVERGRPRDGVRALEYAAALLKGPGRAVWVFPQGEERPLYEPPRFSTGAARIVQLAPQARVVPLGLGYAFGAMEAPVAVAAFGPPLSAEASTVDAIAGQQRGVAEQLDRALAVAYGESLPDVATIVDHRRSRGRGWATAVLDAFAGRLQKAAASQPQRALAPADPRWTERAQPGQQ